MEANRRITVALLKIDELLKITNKTNEQFLYALLSEENVELEGKPYGDGLMELFIVMDPETESLPKNFLNDQLSALGWDIYGS